MKERKQPQDPTVKDEPGSQPKKYFKGLSKDDKEARAKHFTKGSTKPAPGDDDVKTKPSKHTIKYKKMFGESNPDKSLNDKSKKSGISVGILKQVFKRGVKAWQTGHRPGTTAVQWGHARVNSFITKGKGTWGKADSDLAAKVRGEAVSPAQQAAIAISKKKSGKYKTEDAVDRAKELADLKAKHKKEVEDEKNEIDSIKQTNESFNEGKLVTTIDQVLDIVSKKIKSEMGKKYRRSTKDGLGYINQVAKTVGMSVTDKEQAAGKLFLKLDNDLEQDEGLWDNIRKKRARIKSGSGEKMRKKGDKGAPTADQIKQAEEVETESLWDNIRKKRERIKRGSGEKMGSDGSVSKKQFKTSVKFSDNPAKVAAAKARKNKIKGKAKK